MRIFFCLNVSNNETSEGKKISTLHKDNIVELEIQKMETTRTNTGPTQEQALYAEKQTNNYNRCRWESAKQKILERRKRNFYPLNFWSNERHTYFTACRFRTRRMLETELTTIPYMRELYTHCVFYRKHSTCCRQPRYWRTSCFSVLTPDSYNFSICLS